MKRPPKPLAPPTVEERETARAAAAALRAAIDGSLELGEPAIAHVDLSCPRRRGQWWTTWPSLPGFTRIWCSGEGLHYTHASLPGWTYARDEVRAEMIPDLEALAERGERPTTATTPSR